jgi:hypothetical protein
MSVSEAAEVCNAEIGVAGSGFVFLSIAYARE